MAFYIFFLIPLVTSALKHILYQNKTPTQINSLARASLCNGQNDLQKPTLARRPRSDFCCLRAHRRSSAPPVLFTSSLIPSHSRTFIHRHILASPAINLGRGQSRVGVLIISIAHNALSSLPLSRVSSRPGQRHERA